MRTLALFILAIALAALPSPPTATGEPISATAHALPIHDEVLRGYTPPERRRWPGHHRVDLNASPGQLIRVSAPGAVHFTGSIAGMTSVSIMHADGTRTTYQPIDTTLEKRDRVVAGQVIGHLVVNIKRPEPGLRWDTLCGKGYFNPLDLIQRRLVVPKPVCN